MNRLLAETNIGLIGVGLMGLGIAKSLRRQGLALSVLDHPGNQPIDDLLAGGARSYTTPAEVACHSDVIILCVTGSPQVEQVINQEAGLLSVPIAGKTIIDCSTAIPGETRKNAAAVAKCGAAFLDAPMTRTPKEAMEGRLNLIVGGEQEVFERHLALLQCFAENITYAGPVGSGHTLKLLHNFVSIGFSSLLAEAAACSRANGVDDGVLLEVLSKGGGAGVILDRFRPFIECGDDSGFRFSLANSFKDIGYYRAMTEEAGCPHSVANAVLSFLQKACEDGQAQGSLPGLIDYLARG